MKLPFFLLNALLIGFIAGCTKRPSTPAISQTEEQMNANLKNPDYMNRAKLAYQNICSRCHGYNAEGEIGPNLTDEYWIHGDGKIMTLITTIQKGAPDKGMPAWEAISTQEDIELTAAYVFSKMGSNPRNAKAPQGVKK
jgi:cytochrome c oxidase cbb3-type subunit 3